MPSYRVFFFEGPHIRGSAVIEAEDDAAAIEKARREHPDKLCEIWLRKRLVARLADGTSDAG